MIKWRKYFSFSNPENKILLWWFSGAMFFLGLFVKLTSELLEDSKLQKYDQNILLFIGEHLRRASLNGFAVDITSLGSPSVIGIISIIAIIVLIIKKDLLGLFYYLACVIGGAFWSFIIKILVDRPRPQVIPHLAGVIGQSYPSGHSLITTVTFFSIAILAGRHLKNLATVSVTFIVAVLLILLTAFSRLYLGVHYPSDVCSGILFGISWVLFLTATFKVLMSRIKSAK